MRSNKTTTTTKAAPFKSEKKKTLKDLKPNPKNPRTVTDEKLKALKRALEEFGDHAKKKLKTKSLEAIWPQYVKSTYRFNRPHHQVSWNKFFKHALIKIKPESQEINRK